MKEPSRSLVPRVAQAIEDTYERYAPLPAVLRSESWNLARAAIAEMTRMRARVYRLETPDEIWGYHWVYSVDAGCRSFGGGIAGTQQHALRQACDMVRRHWGGDSQ